MRNPKILILEDDSQISKSLKLNLKFDGYEVEIAETLEQARKKIVESKFDMFLFDVGLPDGSGLDLCKEIRDHGDKTPVLFLSARTDEPTVVRGIKLGADDYIRKPFGTEELKARMAKALEKTPPQRDHLVFGPLELDVESRSVKLSGRSVPLARREFEILTVMMKRSGDVTTREHILSALGDDGGLFDRTVDSHISHLRRKFREFGSDEVQIVAVYGVGYRLEVKRPS